MRARSTFLLLGAAAVLGLPVAVAVPTATAPSAAASSALPVDYNWPTGFLGNLSEPNVPPAGAISFDAQGQLAGCSSPGRPPVILVHGTFENEHSNWAAAAPLLRNAGFCVYTFDYGGSLAGAFDAVGPIATSAAEFGSFVDRVRAATGSEQVDVLGHSQGGMMPRYYIKFGDSYTGGSFGAGTSKIRRLIALAPSNHGTTLSGLATLGSALGLLPVIAQLQPAAIDQTEGSAFMRALATCPDGLPSADICAGDQVRYTVLETRYDQVVTPYTNAFLAANPQAPGGVTDLLLQNGCWLDGSEHLAISYDSYAYGLVLAALGVSDPAAVPGASPSCKPIIPYVGG